MFLGSLETGGHFSSPRLGDLSDVRHIVIGPGDGGIYQTVALIKKKAAEGTRQPEVINVARSILAGLPQGATQRDKAQAFVNWFMSNIRYVSDDYLSYTEEGIKHIAIQDCPKHYKQCEPMEIISDAPQILKQRSGDCDDMVLLMGSFLSLAGIQWCPVIVALDSSQPNEFSHVYLVANLDGTSVPIDTVNRSQPFGWEASGAFRRQVMC